MFWHSELAQGSSKLDELVKDDTSTLDDVLDDDYTIQEIRNGNENLIKFLVRPDVVIQLLNGALNPVVDEDLPIQDQYKRAHLCTEILSLNNLELSTVVLCIDSSREMLVNYLRSNNLNHVLVGFYMKIFTQLFSRSPHQWFIECHFAESLCDLLVPEMPPTVHSNVSNLWSELVRLLRDSQYASESKRNDLLLDSLQSERNVRRLMKRMLPDNVEQHCDSVICNAASIFILLLETNFIPNCPSHQLGNSDERVISSHWTGGAPSAENELSGSTVWQPDAGRVVETIVGASADRIFNAVVNSLKVGDGNLIHLSDAWCPLLRLLASVLDTNHLATHQAILSAFSSLSVNPFTLLFAFVNARPKLNILQQLITRIISYILFTLSPTSSPLIPYLIKDFDLIGQILMGAEASREHFVRGCSRKSLHGFYMNLALVICSATESSSNAALITKMINESDKAARWQSFWTELTEYDEQNRADDTGIIPPPPSNLLDTAKIDACDVPDEVNNTNALMEEYEKKLVPKSMPVAVNISYPSSSNDQDYDIPSVVLEYDDMAKDFVDLGNEELFEALCTLKIDTSIATKDSTKATAENWPMQIESTKHQDPEKKQPVKEVSSPKSNPPSSVSEEHLDQEQNQQTPKEHAELARGDNDDDNIDEDENDGDDGKTLFDDEWPVITASGSNSDNWADFTSMKPDDWPPLNADNEGSWVQKDSWDKDICSESAAILSPSTAVAGAIASAIIASSLEERKSSEC